MARSRPVVDFLADVVSNICLLAFLIIPRVNLHVGAVVCYLVVPPHDASCFVKSLSPIVELLLGQIVGEVLAKYSVLVGVWILGVGW